MCHELRALVFLISVPERVGRGSWFWPMSQIGQGTFDTDVSIVDNWQYSRSFTSWQSVIRVRLWMREKRLVLALISASASPLNATSDR